MGLDWQGKTHSPGGPAVVQACVLTLKHKIFITDSALFIAAAESRTHTCLANQAPCLNRVVPTVNTGSIWVLKAWMCVWRKVAVTMDRSGTRGSSYKRVKGRSQTVEKRIRMHPHKPHATSQPSLLWK